MFRKYRLAWVKQTSTVYVLVKSSFHRDPSADRQLENDIIPRPLIAQGNRNDRHLNLGIPVIIHFTYVPYSFSHRRDRDQIF